MLESAAMNPNKLREWLIASITQRFRSNSDLTLSDYVFSNSLFHFIESEQVEFMFTHRSELADYLSRPDSVKELVQHCMESTKCYTYERNQFVNFTNEYDVLLRVEYTDFIQQFERAFRNNISRDSFEADIRHVMKVHHERLRLIMASYCVTYQDNPLHSNPLLRTVPCEEYTAPFQLSILGLSLTDLLEPVLDIGCGENGTLVHYLCEQGISAYGIDRLAPDKPNFFQNDWFDFDYTSQAWGTVLAHQSLSTHFIYAYLHQPQSIEKFAKLTMKILFSLHKGSSLCYAPGMPFFEAQVEKMSQFSLTRKRISMRLPEVEQFAYSAKIEIRRSHF